VFGGLSLFMTAYAILIDGGFLKRKLGTAKAPASAEQIREFSDKLQRHPALAAMTLHRIYYYDALPFTETKEVPLGADRINFGTTDVAERNGKLIQAVTRYPFFATRLGETVFRGWQVKGQRLREKVTSLTITKDDMQPVISQKGVDMRIGLDVASLVLKNIASVMVLVTGDSDFVPVMKFARREGAQLFLVTLGHGIRDSLAEHADLMLEIKDCP
jgi:uncharacterized LabA/DUF88 family protein